MNTLAVEDVVWENTNAETTLRRLRGAGWLPGQGPNSEYAACIPVIATALGGKIQAEHLCSALPHIGNDVGLVEVLNTLSHLGYIGRPARVRICDLDSRLLPCLFIAESDDPRFQGPIVVTAQTREAEEGANFQAFSGREEEHFDIACVTRIKGTVYTFISENDLENITSDAVRTASDFTWFRSILQRFRGMFWQVFALSGILGMVSLAAPLLVMLVYDRVISAHSLDSLQPLVTGALLALVTEWGIRGLRAKSFAWFSARIDYIVSNQIFGQLMLMSPLFTERAAVTSQISRLKAFETVRDFFNSTLFIAIIELPFTVIILVALALIAGPVVFVPITVAAVYVGLLFVARTPVKAAIKLASKAAAERQKLALESLEKVHALRSTGVSDFWLQRYREQSGRSSFATLKSNFRSSIVETLAHSIFIIAGALTVVFSVEQIWAGNMTTGTLVACMILVWRVLGPFQMFCTSLPRFEQLKNAIGQVNRMMSIETEVETDQAKIPVPAFKGQITFTKVGLRYTKDNDPVFAGLSFDLQAGQMLAVTGGNGSGKSTLLKLINGLYRPQAGTVRIDGVDIRQVEAIELRQQIAYVSQSPHFFNGTIAENLRFSAPLATDDELKTALIQVDAWEDICALSKGLDTIVGGNKIDLPTALAYRLNLARAYIKQTPIMLFDELPHALLNSDAGEAFFEMLESWKGQRSIILVSHREDYLKLADKVVLLQESEQPFCSDPQTIIKRLNSRAGIAR